MALTEELPIYRATYRLLNMLIRATQGFPRFYKYSLGTRMVDICLDMSMLIYKANSSYEKAEPICEFLGKFSMLQLLLRVCAEQKVIDTKKAFRHLQHPKKAVIGRRHRPVMVEGDVRVGTSGKDGAEKAIYRTCPPALGDAPRNRRLPTDKERSRMTEQELIKKQEEGGNETLYLMKVGMFFHAYGAGAFALARLMHYRVKCKERKGGREVLAKTGT